MEQFITSYKEQKELSKLFFTLRFQLLNFVIMCGIFGYLGKATNETEFFDAYNNIRPRGPERSKYMQIDDFIHTYNGFHRLSLSDISGNGDQPFFYEDKFRRVYSGCNGEIYNYKQLVEKHDIKLTSGSDSEVIIKLYLKFGIEKAAAEIRGEYALYIYDYDVIKRHFTLYLMRDHCGIRPLFYGYSDDQFAFASEVKGLTCNLGKPDVKQIVPNVKQFPPRHYLKLNCWLEDGVLKIKQNWFMHIDYSKPKVKISDLKEAKTRIRKMFTDAVVKRLDCDREIGALLSGGLDSSLVAAIAAQELAKQGKKLKTFCIGLPNSTDRLFAEMVAAHIGSEHTHIELTEADFLGAIGKIVEVAETYDITTIRATTGNYLVAKWIKEHTDVKALIIGDGADELCSGYMYFHNAPDPVSSHKENIRLLENLHFYDCLRADRAIASCGLEARVPFLDLDFINLYLSIDPKLRIPLKNHTGLITEKYLLREAFKDTNVLPDEVLFRKKEAFSDGVSSTERSWYHVIQEKAEKIFLDEEFEDATKTYGHLPPTSKEALYFRLQFEELYGKGPIELVVPGYWLPKWSGDIKDPSARLLNVYDESSRAKRA